MSNTRNATATSTPETEDDPVGMLSEFSKEAWASAVAKAMAETSDTSACKDKDDGEHKCASDPQPATC
jgi:hypothetical protein